MSDGTIVAETPLEATVETICNLLVTARLVPDEALRGLRQRWLREAAGAANDATQFTRWLVANEYLTDFQAARLLKGQSDRYFLGPYKLLDRIGRGDAAGVFKAVHKLGQIVAVKVLPPSKAKDPESFGRFKREARLAMRLQHPNVVRTFQTGESDGLHFIVMEYLEGEALEAVLQRRRLPPAEAARLIYQALLGLGHLHEHGLVHRDLKPDNLMLTPACRQGETDSTRNATLKIVDIGLCKALFEEGGTVGESGELTVAGSLLGGADYRAPEQSRDARKADIRSDIYTLGCVLYRCLTGQTPFPDSNPMRQIVRHATETPRPLRDFDPAAPEQLQKIVSTMLAKDPALRFPTPERAAQTFLNYLTAEHERVKTPETPAQMQAYLTWLAANEPADVAVTPAGGLAARIAGLLARWPKLPKRWTWAAALVVVGIVAASVTAFLSLRGPSAPLVARPENDKVLAQQAHVILEKYCFRCHGRDGAARGQVNYILNRDRLVSRGKVVPKDADRSKLIQLIAARQMPPESAKERPSDNEVALLRKWIDAGAPSWAGTPVVRHLDYAHILTVIHDDLQTHSSSERKYQRYFTLSHLYNQPEVRKELPLYRAALAKLINSLSWQPNIIIPRGVDEEQTVFAVNLQALGWDTNDLWENEVLGRYPYGMRHDGAEQDEKLAATAKQVYGLSGSLQPFVRADWFLARASQPPIYHSLLFHKFRIPEKATDLERELGIDVADNIRKNKVVRAGYLTSNISAQNRMVERHATTYGAYWKSYDFGPNNNRRNLLQYPLGPSGVLPIRYNDFAFKHDGGEMIFSLPNGLQGYFLADGHDTRLDEAPVAIVRDKDKRFSGSEVIVNGLSCMGCHIQGMIDGPPAGDAVRAGSQVPDTTAPPKTGKSPTPTPLAKVRSLYPEKKTLEDLLAEDRRRFVQALQQATSGFMEITTVEPISATAKPYYEDLGLQALAAELCLESSTRLRQKLNEERMFVTTFQLGALVGNEDTRGTIARTLLEQLQGRRTTFQELARLLKLGTPVEREIDLPP